jgi:acyl-CoA thioesterase I
MNTIALYFASGESLYTGAALLAAAIVFSPYLRHPLLLRLRSLATWVALALIVMACPPFPWIVDLIFFATFAVWLVTANRNTQKQSKTRIRVAATVSLLALLVVLPASEVLHRRKPMIVGFPSDHLVVIGDSISAGIDPRTPAWPSVLQQETRVPAKNLAQPGAQVRDGLSMAEQVKPDDRVVLIEIGGNDLLGETSSEEFGRGLDSILLKLATPGRTVVMFELPLLPNKIAYGKIQRRLAAKYGVWLIPKRCLVDVLGGRDATTDGLHLTPAGARSMASLVAEMLSHVLKTPAPHGFSF